MNAFGNLITRGMIAFGYPGFEIGPGYYKVGFINIVYMCQSVWDCHLRP